MRLARVALPGALVLGFAFADAGAQCPTNDWYYGPLSGSSSAAAFHSGLVNWDLVAGTFSVSSCCGGETGSSSQVLLRDTYWLVGPASAIPIGLRARVDLAGNASAESRTLPGNVVGCFGSGTTFELREGAAASSVEARSSSTPCQGAAIDEMAVLVLEKLPGEPFTLNLKAFAWNSTFQQCDVSGLLTFALPPGYSIASCQGFAGPTVPATPASWGKLKSAYR
jgi:hypothetical protein